MSGEEVFKRQQHKSGETLCSLSEAFVIQKKTSMYMTKMDIAKEQNLTDSCLQTAAECRVSIKNSHNIGREHSTFLFILSRLSKVHGSLQM